MSATADAGAMAALERVRPWLEPIPGPAPGGAPARTDPAYETIAQEVAKLESPSGGAVDWRSVVAGADALLRARSKDLLVAAYLAHALQVTEGAQGLAAGMALLAGLAERYWDVLYPEKKRLRGRVSAIQWFVERSAMAAPVSGRGLSAAAAESLSEGARSLAAAARARLGDAAPGFGPLLEALERVRLSVAASEAAREAPAVAPAISDAGASGASTNGRAVAPAVELPVAALAPGELSAGADATGFLVGIGEALVEAGGTLRRADAGDAVAYRVLRAGLWMHLASAPPDRDGRTTIAPPPAAMLEKLAALRGHERWAELLEESESALPRHRFALDLHRHTDEALSRLGGGYLPARDAVSDELCALLSRMPRLTELAFADGSPFAAPATRAWIEEVVAPRPVGPKFGHGRARTSGNGASDAAAGHPLGAHDGEGGQDGEAQARFDETCRKLARGEVAVLAELERQVLVRPDGRSRFVARLTVARACAAAGLAPLALAAYEGLERESVEHRLEVWEPALAAECLRGLVSAAKASGKDPRCAMPRIAEQFRKLCRLDPEAAQEVWP